jgi:hypothetical protein
MVNQVTQSEGFKDENKIKQIPNTDPWLLLHHVVFLPQSFHYPLSNLYYITPTAEHLTLKDNDSEWIKIEYIKLMKLFKVERCKW